MKNLLMILFLAATSLTVQAGEPVKSETSTAKSEAAAAAVAFKGNVADVENYKPVSAAEIIISSADKAVTQTIVTDEKGNFACKGLPSGIYNVKIACKGYESYSRNSVVIEDGKMLNLGFSLFRN